MITFRKIKWDDIPEPLAKRVMSWSDKEIIIDDIGLTVIQTQRLKDFMLQEGYREV